MFVGLQTSLKTLKACHDKNFSWGGLTKKAVWKFVGKLLERKVLLVYHIKELETSKDYNFIKRLLEIRLIEYQDAEESVETEMS